MPAITSANVAQAIAKLVASRTLGALRSNMVMAQLVRRDFEPQIGNVGDAVNVPIAPTMTASNIAEAGTVQTQNPNLGNASIVLNTHAESTFQIPDVTKVLASPDLLRTYLEPAAIAVAEKIETELLNLYPQFTFNTAVGAANTALTEDAVDDAETALFAAKVPPSSPKYLVTAASSYSDLRQLARFSEVDKVGPNIAITQGEVGRLKNFFVFRSQLVPKVSTTTYNQAFAPDALALVMRRLPTVSPGMGAVVEYVEESGYGLRVVMSYAPNSLAQQFTVDALFGVGMLRPSHAVQVLS